MEALTGEQRGEGGAARGDAAGVVVLGAGRSGTSAVTRAFLAAGFFAGRDDELLGAAPSNPVGHYEPLPVLETNERLLERLGSGAPSREQQLALRDEVEPKLRQILEQIAARGEGAPLAIKEPRINRLLPLWGPVLDGVLHPVLAVRDPLEAAQSASHHYEIPVGHTLAVWEVQTTFALDWLDGRTATIAPHAELMNDPRLAGKVVRDATAHLDPSQAEAIRPQEASAALQPDLRTQRSDESAHAEFLTQRQAELWRYLRGLPCGDVRLKVPGHLREPGAGALAAVRAEDERMKLVGTNEALSASYTEAIAQASDAEQRCAAAHRAGLRAAEGEQRAMGELERVRRSLSWRLTAPLRRLTRLFKRG